MRLRAQITRLRVLVCLTSVLVLTYCGLAAGMADHTGWPSIGHHKGHPNNESGTMRGWKGVHNELLGGASSDTIYAGNMGDVI